KRFDHISPVLQALLVTFLGATSFIIIKKGLQEIPPITFAGLRSLLACIFFLPIILKTKCITKMKNLSKLQWLKIILLGLLLCAFTQGAVFLSLSYLPTVTVSLMLNFTPLIVAILSIYLLKEKLTIYQWSGLLLFLIGIICYFLPYKFVENKSIGLVIIVFGVLANAGAQILARNLNRNKDLNPILITFIGLGISAIFLLVTGISRNGIPVLTGRNWFYIIWLAGVNSAFAFTLWNHTLRSLTAMQSSIINGTMLFQTAILAWIFLNEHISWQQTTGILIAFAGAVLIQIKFRKSLL
ncbi:DMT family transporter, partial [Candidatus Cloacimonadota bacterium]